jgi:hypothetical protein
VFASLLDITRGSAFLAVSVNSMRLSDKWVCISVALHHMIANKQYIATYKRVSTQVSILLAYEGTILACGSSRVNIELVVEGKWCPGYLEGMWYIPNIGRHLFSVWSASEHEISVIIKHQWVMFQHSGPLVSTGRWMTDAYGLDMCIVVPRERAEVDIAMVSETLQLWH